jgi:hypothetical protein
MASHFLKPKGNELHEELRELKFASFKFNIKTANNLNA